MNKTLWCGVTALFALIDCAYGTETGEEKPVDRHDSAKKSGVLPDPSIPDFSDPICVQVIPKPPGIPDVCGDFIAHDHPPYPVLNQFSIKCAKLIDREDCTVWAINPYHYDVYTWAYCCIPGDAGTFR